MTKTALAAALTAALLLSVPAAPPVQAHDHAEAADAAQANPFLGEWTTPFGAVPFDRIRPDHFVQAFEAGMASHLKEVEAITKNPAAPDFANTIAAISIASRRCSST